jgi:hypothetical protein
MRQARLGLGGDKLDAPTDQHDKRYGCSGRAYAKRSSAHGRRIVPARLAVARHDMSRDGKGGQKAALSLVVDGVASQSRRPPKGSHWCTLSEAKIKLKERS